MKRSYVACLLAIAVLLAAFVFTEAVVSGSAAFVKTAEYLRIHIRADSNDEAAQSVKYEVRDRVVEYLIPVLAYPHGKEEAKAAINDRLREIEKEAEKALALRGFSYGAEAELKRESFPTRVYDGITLPAGEYEALILKLGSGQGDNWWCVAYPPLCFSSANGKNVVYKSLIAERIREWKERVKK